MVATNAFNLLIDLPPGSLTDLSTDPPSIRLTDLTPPNWTETQSQDSTSIAAVGDRMYLAVCQAVTEPDISDLATSDPAASNQAVALLYEYQWETQQWMLLEQHSLATAPTDAAEKRVEEAGCYCQLTVIGHGDRAWLFAHFLTAVDQRLLVAIDSPQKGPRHRPSFVVWKPPLAHRSLIMDGAYHDGALYARMVDVKTAQVSIVRTSSSQMPPTCWEPVALPKQYEQIRSVTAWASQPSGLYSAIANPVMGFELWCYVASTDSWQQICQKGLYRYSLNAQIDSMVSFHGNLYFTTAQLPTQIFDDRVLDHALNPTVSTLFSAGFELIRQYEGDGNGDWDLLAGQPRFTPQGLRVPLSCKGLGFDSTSNKPAYLAVHRNQLYLGFQSFEGFQLWRSPDGDNWTLINVPELNSYYQLHRFETASTPLGLVMACDAQTMPGSQTRRLFLYQDSSHQ